MATEHVIAKLISHSKEFEIIIDADKVREYKSGKITDIRDILAVDGIFRNLRKVKSLDKGVLFKNEKNITRIEESELESVFKTTDITEIAKQIIDNGEIQYTTEQRKEFLEHKRTAIINLIASQSIDPRTNAPHTAARIESAMKEERVPIDMYRPAESQVQNIVKAITQILPIRLEFKEIQIKVPVRYAGTIKKIMLDYGQIKKEDWIGTDYIAIISSGAGLVDTFLGKINSITHGEASCRIMN